MSNVSRGALITGYLPHEILSHSIFSYVYREDRLVKLHALWKCNRVFFSLWIRRVYVSFQV